MKLELWKPVRPHKINRAWGIADPLYIKYGFSLHNGIDINLYNGQVIRAPFDCRVVKKGSQRGGGIYVGLLSLNTYDFEDGKRARVLIDFLHCQEIARNENEIVHVGDIVAYGDNTGESTGPHTHMQCRRVDDYSNPVDTNEANNSFDPEPYFVGYADEWNTLAELRDKVAELMKAFSTWLKK